MSDGVAKHVQKMGSPYAKPAQLPACSPVVAKEIVSTKAQAPKGAKKNRSKHWGFPTQV